MTEETAGAIISFLVSCFIVFWVGLTIFIAVVVRSSPFWAPWVFIYFILKLLGII